MWDAGCVIACVAFFAIAMMYTVACERLGTKVGQ
jgi:hypothetical protein